MDFVTSALIVSWAAILLLTLVVSGLIRQVHELSKRIGQAPVTGVGIRPGAAAPGVTDLLENGGVLLFLSQGCRSCDDVLDEAATWAAEADHDPALHALYAEPAPGDTPIPATGGRGDLFRRYDAVATPFAVVVDASGHVARSEPVGSRSAVRELLDSARTIQSRSS